MKFHQILVNKLFLKVGLLATVAVIFSTNVKAAPVTWTLVMTPEDMVAQPFGLAQLPDNLYAYFTFDDGALLTNGSYRNQVTDFSMVIGNTSWTIGDISDTQFAVQDGEIINFFLDLSFAGGNNNLGLRISDELQWIASDAYDRPTPEVLGSYTLLEGGPPTVSVPEPASFILLGISLICLVGIGRKIKERG